jgi:hypothetical protein
MTWITEFLTSLLAKLIPWMFSGKNVKTVGRTEGLEGLDRNSVTGIADLTPEDLPDL